MKEYDTENDRADSPYPGPYRICRAYRNGLYRLGKQHHAHCQTEQKASSPQPPCSASDFLHLSQTKRKSGFKKTGDNQDNPVHKSNFTEF